MRLLVYGGWYGSGNIGDDAILAGVRELFRGHELVALSTDPDQTSAACGVEARRLLSPREALWSPGYLRGLRGFDACLVTGGTPLYDWDHASRILHAASPALGGRLVFFGVGCKAIGSLYGRALTGVLVSRAARVSARDPYSRSVLMSLGRNVELTGDSALWMKPAEPRLGGSYAVVCPRALSLDARSQYHDPVDWRVIQIIRERVAEAADALAERGLRVVFTPFHAGNGGGDAEETRLIQSMMRNPSETADPRGPEDAAGLIAGARVVVGLRLHSLILAAGQGIPFATVGYDSKIESFCDAAGTPWLSNKPSQLGATALKALDERREVGKTLLRSCEGMKDRIRREAEAVVSHFEGGERSRRIRPSSRISLTSTP